jgi:hypothetical protein
MKEINYEEGFQADGSVGKEFMYMYFAIALGVALYWIFTSQVKFKIELLILCFFLMTNNINEFLTFKIPGFEVKPERALFLVFSFLLARNWSFFKDRKTGNITTMPWFIVMVILFVIFKTASQIYHFEQLGGPSKVPINFLESLNIIVLIYAVQIIVSKESINIIGKCIIFAGIFTVIVGIIQVVHDPFFMRIGDLRRAYGSVMRANGIFTSENYNSCFMILSVAWVLYIIPKGLFRLILLGLLSLGVFLTFHRMSYLILFFVFAVYFLTIEKIRIDRLILAGLMGVCALLVITILFNREIMNSQVVQERLAEDQGGRLGYYVMVGTYIGQKPILGFGGKNNQVYYESMLRITRESNRATGTTGGIHNSYLSIMFYFGIPAFIFYTTFVLTSILYFAKLSTYHIFFSIPLVLGLFYAIGGLTNSYLFHRFPAILYAIHIGLGMGAMYLKDFIPSQTEQTKTLETQV